MKHDLKAPWLSIIIPVLNEASQLELRSTSLNSLKALDAEIIVVDGGSDDESLSWAKLFADKILTSPRGRARQMNTGAQHATGQWLLFLHIDSHISTKNLEALKKHQQTRDAWGRFSIHFRSTKTIYAVIAKSMNARSQWSRICTGDQGMFVTRSLFQARGGFPQQALMEDIELSKRLKRDSRFLPLSSPLSASVRYWEKHGVIKSIFRMWRLRLLYALGAAPERLHKQYYV